MKSGVKAAASVWQVRRHLRLYEHSAAAAVGAAGALVAPLDELALSGADGLAIDALPTYAWLRRIGQEKHAKAFEDEGYTSAQSLYGLSEGCLSAARSVAHDEASETQRDSSDNLN